MIEAQERWDVIVVGGALAGASAACLLVRNQPGRRILILEKSQQHGRRVGESTVEMSAFFLGKVLGLTEHLLEHHLPKQGMRFWAMNERTPTMDACSEIGPGYNVRLPGYQVDRAVLDEHVLAAAAAAGAVVRRGVRVPRIDLAPGGDQIVHCESAGERTTLSARWVIDASGFAALLARQEGWFKPNTEHPTAACWGRWTGVTSWDDPRVAGKYPQWAHRCRASRGVATNHLTGYGWWAWWIPLRGGDVSIGVVYDQRLCELPAGPSLGERLRTMIESHPAGKELLRGAQLREHDLHYRANLAYVSTQMATDGAVLVGDAAGFLDPFYSPGMDWIATTVSAAVSLIEAGTFPNGKGVPSEQRESRGRVPSEQRESRGRVPSEQRESRGRVQSALAERIERHNRNFTLAYDRWFRALYKDKYYYLGDHELMATAFRLDLGMYYLGAVLNLFRTGASALEVPPFARPYARLPAELMALYNRRMARIGRTRHQRGKWGPCNAGRYFAFTSYEFNRRLIPRVLAAGLNWLWLEAREVW